MNNNNKFLPLMKSLAEAIDKAISGSEKFESAVAAIKAEGGTPVLRMGLGLFNDDGQPILMHEESAEEAPVIDAEFHEVKSYVQEGGEVAADLLTDQDLAWLTDMESAFTPRVGVA